MILKSIVDIDLSLLRSFSCGNKDLDNFLNKHAYDNDKNGYGKTYVLIDKNIIVGFFTICSAQIRFEAFPNKSQLTLPRYPIPSVRIARLGVHKDYQHQGYGRELLKQAFLKILNVASSIGIKLVIVDAKESSKSFYEHYGFERLVDDRLTYFLPIETLLKAFNNK